MVSLVQCGNAKNNAYKQLFFCSIYQGKLQRFPQSSETSFFLLQIGHLKQKKRKKLGTFKKLLAPYKTRGKTNDYRIKTRRK
jgi:hypothetical protein